MTAQRPIVMEALRDLLETEITAIDGRICFPWDAKLNPEDGPIIQILLGKSTVDSGAVIGMLQHQIPVNIGVVVAGAFDYAATWDILDDVAKSIDTGYTLGGKCEHIVVVGCDDFVDVSGEKIMWPHLVATIEYMTQRGSV